MVDEEEEHQVIEKTLQESVILHTDIKNDDLIEKLIRYTNDAFENSNSDKEICTKLRILLDKDTSMNKPSNPQKSQDTEELGAWQCIIGKQFCASVTFDAEYLCYFSFPKHDKYFMVFRS